MADCSATSGTVVDRTARAVLGSTSAAASLQPLLGHMSTGLPAVAPQHAATTLLTVPQSNNSAAQQQHIQQPTLVYPPQAALQQQMMQMHQQQQKQQQQHFQQQIMIQQQQQVIMMQQQQQQHAARLAQQAHLKQEAEQPAETTASNPIRDNQKALEEHLEQLGHEGWADPATMEELAAAWEEAQQEFLDSDDAKDDYWQSVYNGDDASLDAAANMAASWWNENEARSETYQFRNPVKEESTDQARDSTKTPEMDWMAEGTREFNNGNIPRAIHAFEMELQQSNPDNATAWRLLGQCHAEQDMDVAAIQCLQQAVERDPYSAESLLALGVSCVNELQHEQALQHLTSWLEHNPALSGLALPDDPAGSSSLATVQRLLQQAHEYDPASASILEALGVVYNVSRDYDAAVEAFQEAVSLEPDQYPLWNKLGATLANSQRSSEALPAYQQALQRKPKYARAWLNMAIAHANLQNFHQAARCYLQTLSLNPEATHCWSYLRIAVSQSERWELLPLVAQQDLKAFQEHFDFVLYDHGSKVQT